MRVSRILLWLALLLVLFLVAACAQDTVLWKNPKPIQGPGINPSDEADNPRVITTGDVLRQMFTPCEYLQFETVDGALLSKPVDLEYSLE